MTVGELSRRTGVPIKSLRQYTDWGLINTVGRSATNYRLFDSDALWCVEMIGRLRGLGLTVAEIRGLTGAQAPIGPHLAELLDQSRDRLTRRITELHQTLRRIEEFEAVHHAELASHRGARWAGDPHCVDPHGVDPHCVDPHCVDPHCVDPHCATSA